MTTENTLSNNEAVATESKPVLPPCSDDIYKHGVVVGIFDVPKEKAEQARLELSEKSPTLNFDWHYSGGRVIMKALHKEWPKEDALATKKALLIEFGELNFKL